MKDLILDDFQNSVSDSLMRHKSVLDIMTKLTESNSRVNRAIAKSVSSCGCICIDAHKQKLPPDADMENVSTLFSHQIDGKLCESCREVLEEEIGSNLYYITALCDALGINLFDILLQEYKKIETLGKFTLL